MLGFKYLIFCFEYINGDIWCLDLFQTKTFKNKDWNHIYTNIVGVSNDEFYIINMLNKEILSASLLDIITEPIYNAYILNII